MVRRRERCGQLVDEKGFEQVLSVFLWTDECEAGPFVLPRRRLQAL